MDHLLTSMARYGLDVADLPPEDRPHHTVIGQTMALTWLKAKGVPRPVRKALSSIIGAHHGVPPGFGTDTQEQRKAAWGSGAWDTVRDELMDGIGADIPVVGAVSGVTSIPMHVQVDLVAMVVLADWLASNVDLFDPDDNRPVQQRASDAWEAIDLPPSWDPQEPPHDPTALLHDRFPKLRRHQPHPVQRAAANAAWEVNGPCLMIIEDQMGKGKTEAGFLAAETLAHRFGLGGVYIGLPTMATSNAMFGRALDWVERLPGIDDASIQLAHSKSHLNDRFSDIQQRTRIAAVYDDDTPLAVSVARAHGWLTGRWKGNLASFVVGTIDQVLLIALLSRHMAMRQFALSGKVVVVDEVHAADDYMRSYLCAALRWLGHCGTPVILMSATLPSAQRNELVNAYAQGRGHDGASAPSSPDYPRITVWDDHAWLRPVAQPTQQRQVSVQPLADDVATLVALLREELRDGGCAAVIRNTVNRSQETYDALKHEFGDDAVLFHSRFVAPDRARKEAALQKALGHSGERPERMIVVGTQVLEQSLDIDFDVMVSDLAPMDLLMQRIGRLHRHDRVRPRSLSEARLYVAAVPDWTVEPIETDGAADYIYTRAKLLRTALALKPHLAGLGVCLPADIPRLVELAYSPDQHIPTTWLSAVELADQEAANRRREAERRAGDFQDRSLTDGRSNLAGMLDHRDVDEKKGRAQVRDSEDGIEVVVAREVGGVRYVWDSSRHHPGAVIPDVINSTDERIARAAASCTLNLPMSMCVGKTGDAVIRFLEDSENVSGWRQSRWLGDELVLLLGPGGRARVLNFELTYDDERGLSVTRTEEESQ